MKLLKSKEKLIPLIQNTFLFRNTDIETIRFILYNSQIEFITFEKGDIIYGRNSYKKSIGIIIKGKADVRKETNGGRSVLINILNEGNMFGGAALYTEENCYIADISAEKKCKILFISKELLTQLFKFNINTAENYISFLSNSLIFLNKKIDSFTPVYNENKLNKFLYENMVKTDDGYEVDMKYSYTKLSEFLNIGRSSLYKSLELLTENNVIKKDGKKIIILAPNSLK